MSERLGFVGILVEDRARANEAIQRILADHAELIVARLGIPNVREQTSVITLVVRATTDALGRLTGKLGMVDGVQVKSALGKEKQA